MESFGKYLKNEREARGFSIDEISNATKISPGQLRALESDDLSSLPPAAYIKGFVKAYAKHIGLNPDEAIIRFENYLQEIDEEDNASTEFLGPATFKRDTPHIGIVLAAGIVIGLIILFLLLLARACSGGGETGSVAPDFNSPAAELILDYYPNDGSVPLYGASSDPIRVRKEGRFISKPRISHNSFGESAATCGVKARTI